MTTTLFWNVHTSEENVNKYKYRNAFCGNTRIYILFRIVD